MNGDSHPQKSNGLHNDEVFSSLSIDEPLVDAGYGPVHSVPRPHKPKQLGRKLLIACAALVVAAGLVAGGVALAKHHHKTLKAVTTASNSNTSSNASSSANSNAASSSNAGTAAPNTKTFTSNESALSLSLNYPNGWTVSPATTAPAGTSNIAVTSGTARFTDASGAAVTGKAVVTIRPGSVGISELSSGTVTAAQNSVQIGYTNPAAGQHKYPYITFLHLPSGEKVNGAFEEVMITGINQFNAGTTVTTVSLTGLDPIISVAFLKCNGTACTTPLSITNNTWTNNATAVEALNIFQSLQLK